MSTLKILVSSPFSKWISNVHPYYRWKKQLREQGIKLELYFDHTDKRLRNSENLLIHSRYFGRWKKAINNQNEYEERLAGYLNDLKKDTGKLIWNDEADSTGTTDFSIIEYVDVFAKKQVLKNKDYYTQQGGQTDMRIWLNNDNGQKITVFKPCPTDQLGKIKVSWNLGVVDYRYYPKRFNKISNYLSYKLYSPRITPVDRFRDLDLAFRGSIKYNDESNVSGQRNKVIEILQNLNSLNIATGGRLSKYEYLKELSNTKVSISPFGFGEVCYRDFETFNSGSLLIKPSMEHLVTYPDVFIPHETYIPVSWDLSDLAAKIEDSIVNYNSYKQIAKNGQEHYMKVVNDPTSFVHRVKALLS